jgi:hypothetical protein
VRGHQDDKKTGKKKLTWVEKLNIRADQLATKARIKALQSSPPKFIPCKEAKVYLYINEKPITRNIQQEVHNAYNSPDLREFLCQKYKWKHHVPDTIHWEHNGLLYKSLDRNEQRFITRYIYQRLPLHGSSYSKYHTKACPICQHPNETFHHFLNCNKNKEKWSELTVLLTDSYNKVNLDPQLRILHRAAILGQDIQQAIAQYPVLQWGNYQKLINKQTIIGWEHIRYGRFAQEWIYAQSNYENTIKAQGNKTWIRKIIQTTWKFAKVRWEARNKAKFPEINDTEATKENLIFRIKQLYEKKQDLKPQDQHIYRTELDEWPNKSISQMRQWLLVSHPFVSYCIKVNKKQNKTGHQDILKFFPQRKSARLPTRYVPTKKRTKRPKTDIQTTVITKFYHPLKKQTKNVIRQPHTKQKEQTEYYSSQGRPPDQSTRQSHIQDYFQPH